ncbi:hypothetical protein PVAG01_07119 [Phlyctema vagabunda]|uniref:Uncharacterized protein n=1 Tax=Phlyctema vagabunda TaxID=108571 RepID=A0ABR4PBL6_9HELO
MAKDPDTASDILGFLYPSIFYLYVSFLLIGYVFLFFEKRYQFRKVIDYYIEHAPTPEQRQKTLAQITESNLRWIEASEKDAIPWTRGPAPKSEPQQFYCPHNYQAVASGGLDNQLDQMRVDENMALNLRLFGTHASPPSTNVNGNHLSRIPPPPAEPPSDTDQVLTNDRREFFI